MITCFGQNYHFGESSHCWLSSFSDDQYDADVYVATESYDNKGPSIAEARQELWTQLANERKPRENRKLIFFEVFNVFSWPIRKHGGYQGIRAIKLVDGEYIAEEPSREWKDIMEREVAEAVEGSIWHNVVRERYLKEFREDGQKIKDARKSLGLKQDEFAAKLGISKRTLKRIEAGETETKVRIMRLVEAMIAPESEKPIQYRFTFQRFDKLVDQGALLGQDWPDRDCENCKKTFPARDIYAITPIDFRPWLAESPTLDTFKAFGPNRCKSCLPMDAIDAGDFLKKKKTTSAQGGDSRELH
jgi:transcriptional regulator with XRE-family HTH domain